MHVEITEDDLLTRLTKAELDELSTTAIEGGQADPKTKAIAGGLGEIRAWVDPEELDEDLLYRLWLALAVPILYPRQAVVPAKHKDEQSWARDLLKQLREGKFPGSETGAWGSDKQFKPRANRETDGST